MKKKSLTSDRSQTATIIHAHGHGIFVEKIVYDYKTWIIIVKRKPYNGGVDQITERYTYGVTPRAMSCHAPPPNTRRNSNTFYHSPQKPPANAFFVNSSSSLSAKGSCGIAWSYSSRSNKSYADCLWLMCGSRSKKTQSPLDAPLTVDNDIEQITDRRPSNKDVDAIYLLSPQPHIVDCVMADFAKRKYRRAHLVWTSLLHPTLRDRIDKSQVAREQIALFKVLNAEFFPRESHLVTFRDPWSFPVLFHPACNGLVRQHMEDIAQKDELDLYAKFHEDFPPPTIRPRGTLYVLDRSIDLFAPFLHEFTYQAMAHDLLPIREGDKITYRTILNEGSIAQQEKDIEISEKDKIWIENRHRHMKDTIDRLMADFQRFIKDNPNFTKDSEGGANSLNAIKDMLAGLPQFQEMKEAYALHLGMSQESMNRFQKFKLLDLASLEQILATGLDEEYKKAKGIADQVVRMLDEEAIIPPDRLRLLTMYMLNRDGLLPADLEKLLAHAQLPPQDAVTIRNLEHVGARTSRGLKDPRPLPQPLFPRKPPPAVVNEDYALSRYEPALQSVLEAHATNSLDDTTFPYTKPPLDMGNDAAQQTSAQSLRSAKPTWAKGRTNVGSENKQRVIIFMAGGATYSESRACYEIGRSTNREVFLVTSHMLTPSLFIRQVADLSQDRRRLDLPAERAKPKAPAHLFEPDDKPRSAPQQHLQQPQQGQRAPAPPSHALANLSVNGRPNGSPSPAAPEPQHAASNGPAKLTKDVEKKKKHHFFGKKDKS
nr:protein transport protein sec1 [Quercus suber]